MIPTPAPDLHVGDVNDLARAFVRIAEDAAARAIVERGMFSLALPGGSAAERLCPALADARVSWKQTHIFWCDERAVSPEDAVSNVGLLRRLWNGTRALAEARLHPMPAANSDLTEAAARYARELEVVCGTPPVIDVLLLGVGDDGHVASLFPGHPALHESKQSVIAVENAPKAPARRLSLTLPTLAQARQVVVAAFGTSKANAIQGALEQQSDTPIARVVRGASMVHVLVDADAARLH